MTTSVGSPQQPAWLRYTPLLLAAGYLALTVAVAAATYVAPSLGNPVQNAIAAAAFAASLRPVRVVAVQDGGPRESRFGR